MLLGLLRRRLFRLVPIRCGLWPLACGLLPRRPNPSNRLANGYRFALLHHNFLKNTGIIGL